MSDSSKEVVFNVVVGLLFVALVVSFYAGSSFILRSIDKDWHAYKEVRHSESIPKLEQFLSEYPDSKWAEEAKESIRNLREKGPPLTAQQMLEKYSDGDVNTKKNLFNKLVKDKKNWPILIQGLESGGDRELAIQFMNESTSYWLQEGSPLYDAGHHWARSHGCRIYRGSRAGDVSYQLGGCY